MRRIEACENPSSHAGEASIRAKRLAQCRRDLANPLVRQPIHAIAARWGFRDKAHFSRLFRARYGRSPQAYRTTVAHQDR
ncbi:helix-turn-helix domain-containing protein [Micromonospora sp. DH14]|uniref:helix-turn-helix domain-containing protein n=1 Tax=Micromonospora sp. DH14 TaxID=3040120 RepID=UPI002442316A|nr:helix-turn-helix domain-containing protein [Micromonospora sp. DH14]MDG9673642.1 helix-turn-helix domain-containing protein [Micromonospora sp. DH14]